MSGIYEGYHHEWRSDPSWRYGTKYTKCRRRGCLNSPIAEFDRTVRMSRGRIARRPYAYCADHLYGRKIENGQVLHSVLVKDDDA
jgi:hypothetical protein